MLLNIFLEASADKFQLLSVQTGVYAAIVTIIFTIGTFVQSILIRKAELRLNQAQQAREFIKEIHDHAKAARAIEMLDWYEITLLEDAKQESIRIQYNQVLDAVKLFNKANSYKPISDLQIKELLSCFDWFFYFIDRSEQNINDKLITFKNMQYVFQPYYDKYNRSFAERKVWNEFMKVRGYKLAPNFWKRFDENRLQKFYDFTAHSVPFVRRAKPAPSLVSNY